MLHEFSLKCWHASIIQGWFLKNLEFTTTTFSRFSYANAEIQVNLFQKQLFLHQLTQNVTQDCSLNYKFSTWKFQAQNMGRTCWVHELFWMSKRKQKTICVHRMFSQLGTFMYWTCNSMNNLSSYCGLVDAKIRASDEDLPVHTYL